MQFEKVMRSFRAMGGGTTAKQTGMRIAVHYNSEYVSDITRPIGGRKTKGQL